MEIHLNKRNENQLFVQRKNHVYKNLSVFLTVLICLEIMVVISYFLLDNNWDNVPDIVQQLFCMSVYFCTITMPFIVAGCIQICRVCSPALPLHYFNAFTSIIAYVFGICVICFKSGMGF